MAKNKKQIEDGKWYLIPLEGIKRRCCDCGLTHIYEYASHKGELYYRAWRDERATAQVRRWKK